MPRKDYYLLLGIPRGESPNGIRKAFRDLVRRHHPDHAGPSGTPIFRDIVEAYRVLSDPERRRNYDAELDRRIPVRAAPSDSSVLFADLTSIRPASEDLFHHNLRNFLRPGILKSERPEPLFCDIALSPEEARRGGVLPLRVPIREPCPDCHGAGHVFGVGCRRCDATGDARSEITIPLEVPPRVQSGVIVELPLDDWGIRNLCLRARIHVGT